MLFRSQRDDQPVVAAEAEAADCRGHLVALEGERRKIEPEQGGGRNIDEPQRVGARIPHRTFAGAERESDKPAHGASRERTGGEPMA